MAHAWKPGSGISVWSSRGPSTTTVAGSTVPANITAAGRHHISSATTGTNPVPLEQTGLYRVRPYPVFYHPLFLEFR